MVADNSYLYDEGLVSTLHFIQTMNYKEEIAKMQQTEGRTTRKHTIQDAVQRNPQWSSNKQYQHLTALAAYGDLHSSTPPARRRPFI